MKITFIRPNMSSQKSSDAMEPLVFALLASLTPPDIETILFDDRIENIDFDDPTDLVVMSVETFAAKRSFQISAEYRKRGIPVVMGGYHPTLVPEESLEHADTIVIGDAEPVWSQLIEDARKGNLQRIYKGPEQSPVLETNFDRSIFRNKRYFPVHLVQWGRGCPHNCDFCSIHAFNGTRQIMRPIEDVINELKQIQDNKPIFLVDDNLYHQKKLFIEFLRALIPLKKKWACQISVEITRDNEILDLMQESGCMMVLLGIESFSKESLMQMNKGWSLSKNEYSIAVNRINKRGIMIYGTFVFGYDHDSEEAFSETLNFAIDHKFLTANFNPLYPMPGTALYSRLQQKGRLTHQQWWTDPEFYYGKTMFHPMLMSPEKLERKCFENKQKFNSYPSILYRATNVRSNLRSLQNTLIYFLGNFVNRKEIYRKQGRILG